MAVEALNGLRIQAVVTLPPPTPANAGVILRVGNDHFVSTGTAWNPVGAAGASSATRGRVLALATGNFQP